MSRSRVTVNQQSRGPPSIRTATLTTRSVSPSEDPRCEAVTERHVKSDTILRSRNSLKFPTWAVRDSPTLCCAHVFHFLMLAMLSKPVVPFAVRPLRETGKRLRVSFYTWGPFTVRTHQLLSFA
ncbi:Adenylate-forming reductase Nps11 [Clarias magur]|uniref:Adenylate-forming reductase Nps11 n=1 Tax=Clarias magur TaxID=1594786 RepID=A0A8J4X6H7_CLAMG|nr:Adenylate-forming reductase Nps11 [Clarias magur]